MISWNILHNLAQIDVISIYKSLVDQTFATTFTLNESFGVVSLAMKFLTKVITLYQEESSIFDDKNQNNKAM